MFPLTDVVKFKITAILALVMLAAFLGMVAYFKVQTTALEHTVSEQREKIGGLEVEVSALTAANKQMAAAVKDQNARVEKLVSDFKLASDAADRAIVKAQTDAAGWKAKYQKVLSAPPVSSDECTDLSAKVNAYLSIRAEGGL